MKLIRILVAAFALAAIEAPAHADWLLKQSTASQAVKLGPFVDSVDGNTEKTALTIANTDIKCSKNGGTLASKNSGGGTHDANGWYTATFDATDTNTVGRFQCFVHVSGALPVVFEANVVEEAIYDELYGASALGYVANAPVSVAQWNGTNVATPDTAGYPKITIKDGTGTGEIDTNAGAVVSVTTAATATNLTNAPTAGDLTATMKTSVQTAVLTAQGVLTGTCSSGSTTTCVDAARTEADATQLQDRLICFSDSWCALITTFNPATDTATTTKTAPTTRASKTYTIFPSTTQ